MFNNNIFGQISDLQKATQEAQNSRTKRDAASVKEFLKYSGMPQYRGINQNLRAQRPVNVQGDINDLRSQLNGIQIGEGEGFNALGEEALREGPSKWANLMTEQLGSRRDQSLDDLARNKQGQLNSMSDQLAMRGGVSSGARERMARDVGRDSMRERQNIFRQSHQDEYGIQAQDEQNRLNSLGQYAGMESNNDGQKINLANAYTQLSKYGTDVDMQNRQYNTNIAQYNLDNKRQDHKLAFDSRQNAWNKSMENLAAERQAKATEKSCFLEGELVQLSDGSTKQIKDIEVGDQLLEGGKVICTMKGSGEGEVVYDYLGVNVTSGHLVLEEGKWLAVKNSQVAKQTELKPEFVYNLVTENHKILINDIVFSDYEIVDPKSTGDYYVDLKNKVEGLNSEV